MSFLRKLYENILNPLQKNKYIRYFIFYYLLTCIFCYLIHLKILYGFFALSSLSLCIAFLLISISDDDDDE